MSYLPDRDVDPPFELRREMAPAPDARQSGPRLQRRPPDWRPQGVAVYARPGEHPASLVRRFATAVMREGVLSDARRHDTFMPPGQRRRIKRMRAAARRRKQGAR